MSLDQMLFLQQIAATGAAAVKIGIQEVDIIYEGTPADNSRIKEALENCGYSTEWLLRVDKEVTVSFHDVDPPWGQESWGKSFHFDNSSL